MPIQLNVTHEPARRSWLDAANDPNCDFPIQNLPFGIFSAPSRPARGGIAIGDRILDLNESCRLGLFRAEAKVAAQAASGPCLNPLLELGNRYASALRAEVSDILRANGPGHAQLANQRDRVLVPMSEAKLHLPIQIGGFTDFLCSADHTRRMSPDNSFPPAFAHLPIAYNSRPSSIRISDEPVKRPNGQFQSPDGSVVFGPEPALDFELELGAVVGKGNEIGTPIAIDEAHAHIFGFCLLNDWSARRIQSWESRPLGPFLSKSFSTTLSPWIVTAEALEPFRIPATSRAEGDPALLPYLTSTDNEEHDGLDIALEAYLQSGRMRDENVPPLRVTDTNTRYLYWTFAQMLTHHASNGCNLRPSDLVGSGTVSGPSDNSRACFAELTNRETNPLSLPNGESRAWLENDDEIILRGRASRAGYVSIGFGTCRGRIAPAVEYPA